jgi:hypothetical protein
MRLLLALCFLAYASAALACTACSGQTDDKMAQGMNAGIYALLICIGGVLAGFVGFGVYLARRAAAAPPSAAETSS